MQSSISKKYPKVLLNTVRILTDQPRVNTNSLMEWMPTYHLPSICHRWRLTFRHLAHTVDLNHPPSFNFLLLLLREPIPLNWKGAGTSLG